MGSLKIVNQSRWSAARGSIKLFPSSIHLSARLTGGDLKFGPSKHPCAKTPKVITATLTTVRIGIVTQIPFSSSTQVDTIFGTVTSARLPLYGVFSGSI